MAGIKLNYKKRLAASSILEVIISMVLIVIVFSIAMGIFANVERLALSGKKIQAEAILKEVLLKAEASLTLSKETIKVHGIEVEQEITSYSTGGGLYQISLVAYDDNHEKIAELNKVVYEAK